MEHALRGRVAAVVLVLAGVFWGAGARAAEAGPEVDRAFEELRAYDHDRPRKTLTLIEAHVARPRASKAARSRAS